MHFPIKKTRPFPISAKGLLHGLLITALISSCSNSEKGQEDNEQLQQQTKISSQVIKQENYGATEDGQAIQLYTLINSNGMEVHITNYGGIITSVVVPDKNGEMGDVVLGFDNLDGYFHSNPFFGALVGRYGNRIGNAKFTLDGKEYPLLKNNGPNHLHGGAKGFDKVVWDAETQNSSQGQVLELSYLSKDMEEGYPGNLQVKVTYTLTDENEIRIDYHATTDQKTIVNLTNHSYFNLTGDGNKDILDHMMMINASKVIEVDSTLIPTGNMLAVEGTPFDFTQPTAIGQRIDDTSDQQIVYGKGYDHSFVLNRQGQGLSLAANVYEPNSGRALDVYTTEPGVQFYTGNFLDGSISGKDGAIYGKRTGFCLETQHHPDSPNQPDFPSTVLNPGEEYKSTTVFKFSVKEPTM